MKKYYLCLLLTAFCYNGFSQAKLDSLKKVLAKLPPEGRSFAGDTTRVRVLCEMAFHKAFTLPDSSIIISKIANEISDKINWEIGKAKSLHQIGYSQFMYGKYLIATEYLYKSLKISENLKIDTLIGVNYRQLGNVYYEISKYGEAINYYKLAIPLFRKIKYYRGISNCQNDIGRSYLNLKQYNLAIQSFKECIELSKKNKQYIFENYCNWSIVEAYILQKRFDDALIYGKIGLDLNYKTEGLISYDWMISYNNLSKIHSGLNQPKKALFFAKKAEKYINPLKEIDAILIYENLYKINKLLGNTKEALLYFEKYKLLNDRAKSQGYERQIKNLEYEYQFEKQKENIELLNENSQQDKVIKTILSFGLFAFILFIILLRKNNISLKQKNMQIEEQKNEIELTNEKLENLNENLEKKVIERTMELQNANIELTIKNQEILDALTKGQTIERRRVASELHDNLGSTLSALKWRLEAINGENLNEKERKVYLGIVDMMKNAYAEVRLISHNMLPVELEEKGLFGALKKFVNDINDSNKINLKLVIDETIVLTDKKIIVELYSICMELVNNVLKHAEATEAKISFLRFKNYLELTVSDNGKGLSYSDKSGKGLENIKSRVNSLSGELEVESNVELGTNFMIIVPC